MIYPISMFDYQMASDCSVGSSPVDPAAGPPLSQIPPAFLAEHKNQRYTWPGYLDTWAKQQQQQQPQQQ